VLQEVRDAGDVALFVAGAGADKKAQRNRPSRRARLTDDAKTITEYVAMKWHGLSPFLPRRTRKKTLGFRLSAYSYLLSAIRFLTSVF
jgi:hypothetical protein